MMKADEWVESQLEIILLEMKIAQLSSFLLVGDKHHNVDEDKGSGNIVGGNFNQRHQGADHTWLYHHCI